VSKRQISIKLSSLEKLVSESGHAPVPASALQYIKNHVTKKNDRAERVGTELNKNSLTVSSLITSEGISWFYSCICFKGNLKNLSALTISFK